ncbi:hypothetical protein SELMODRAFT_114688 [Selaginella moellendorffii]|uniref:Dolichyl-diphosphooligosaccharide--protein glycosyltransferase 48 kDa subunit n=1 Tax=Selaginella moellendorffii TaxID=88036 RepID=D8SE02_SELML|nr:dolichyl-diphosphooligosaccharide--protein glycosyltransferase 48 kDa subunit [Selaginella moellendorffii]EFJ17342.1 hypothetical protein SELMODRAFT_114688 [Selaginella moellendorffii]|eukprot:XP_002981527.1 dolichyl-diphosphooligosaccharide--protein glycosyltransferase 48 kDa subunit [Selaginella moellendorffii]
MAGAEAIVAAVVASLILSCAAFTEENPTDRRVLVLLEDLAIESTHSLFFKSLSDRGYELDLKLSTDPKLALQRYGEYLYDALVIFSPSVEKLGGSLTSEAVLDFVDSGHDLILAANSTTSQFIRNLAAECGVEFEEDFDSVVIDHLSFDDARDAKDHSLLATKSLIKSKVILGAKEIQAPILYRGIGHVVSPANSLAIKVLTASSSAYSANPNAVLASPPALTGTSIGLVSVVQARNNARILISGSLDMFSDNFINSPVRITGSTERFDKSGNQEFVDELSKWVFHERGHLKAVNLQHHKVGESGEPSMYRITDHLEFSLEIYEWTGKNWQPYQADDVQVEFYMMSPYVLKTLNHNGKGKYETSFQVPDVYGVFQFKVDYKRLGYTTLDLSKQIPVRPSRHNEYERFIKAAYPYYGGAFSMMAGFFVFGIAFLYHK